MLCSSVQLSDVFDRPQIAELKEICIKLGEGYQRLREHARVAQTLSWPVRPKTHRMQHVPLMSAVINPVFVQCYSEESQIGTTTRLWKRSIAERYQATVQGAVLVKRLVGLLLRLESV